MATDVMDLIRGKRKEIKAHGRRADAVRPPPGKSRWRILPGWRLAETGGEDKTFFRDFGQHFIKNVKGEVKAVVVCSMVTDHKDCETCASLQAAADACTDDAIQKAIADAKSSRAILFNAINMGTDPTKVEVLALTPNTADMFFSQMETYMDPDDGMGEDITSLDKGCDIIIERQGTGLETRYSVSRVAKPTVVDASVMARLHNLDTYVLESDEGRSKALGALSAVTGMAPVTHVGGSKAALTAGKTAALTAPAAAPATKAMPVEDDEIPVAAAPKAAAAKASAPKPAPVAEAAVAKPPAGFSAPVSSEADVEALLADLA